LSVLQGALRSQTTTRRHEEMDVFLWTLQFAGLAIVLLGLALERRLPLHRR